MNNEDDNIKNSYKNLEAQQGEYFQLVKDGDMERICLYIVGASGSGKSYWTTEFVKELKKKIRIKKYI
jgi:ABC-type dipeptide/oligopeptide/nickel transport system ATPase component